MRAHAYKLPALGHNATFLISDHAIEVNMEQQGNQLGLDRGSVLLDICLDVKLSFFPGPENCRTTIKVEIQKEHSTFC